LSQVDQFESIFRSAVKDMYEYQQIEIRSILLVTDLETTTAKTYQKKIQDFLKRPDDDNLPDFHLVTGDKFCTTGELLEILEQYQPDLICTYRNLHSRAWRFPHSLGEHLDVMLQKSTIPIMVMPHPEAGYEATHAMQDMAEVMVVTDLQSYNNQLINLAAHFIDAAGNLYLTHVEDSTIFERYMDAISKIEVINTDTARKRLHQQLLKEPEDYFNSCAIELQKNCPGLTVRSLVMFGDLVEEYHHQISSRQLDLLVLSAKDERQHAMHSVAYPLAVELRQIPLLLI